MKNKWRMIYFIILLICTFIVSTAYFSYAFFTNKIEEHGKLNVVVGTLDYKIESENLSNNKITVAANSVVNFEIKLTSLNDIDSEYELYYSLDSNNDNVSVGYSIYSEDGVSGKVEANTVKKIRVVIKNDSNSSTTVTFGVIGGLIDKELVLNAGNSLDKKIKHPVELNKVVFYDNEVIKATPTLTTSFNNTNDASGLYMSNETNSGNPTYYFRGDIENNYVKFANKIWRIVRVNEDKTVRLILQDGINNNATYQFNSESSSYENMYYSNSDIKNTIDDWYNDDDNISASDKLLVAKDNYYCEQAKVTENSNFTSFNATMQLYNNYTPNFKCNIDGNNMGIINSNIGLITYDEVIHAGGYYNLSNSNCYLYNTTNYWTMSPVGFITNTAGVWRLFNAATLGSFSVKQVSSVRPVINLKSDVEVTGTGTSIDPYVVVTDKLNDKILVNNDVITDEPTLTTSSNNSNDVSGLYVSTETNNGDPTYYFRGDIENNYVKFADKTWRIVRINEDGTIRLILQDGINNNATYQFSSEYSSYENMYYSNSDIKNTVEEWYDNISVSDKLKVATGDYYCEQAKVKVRSDVTSGDATMTIYSSYIPNFKCSTDENGKGLVSAIVGLMTYDEVVYAGGYVGLTNPNYYLYDNSFTWWTMSPSGFGSKASEWSVYIGYLSYPGVDSSTRIVRPVINLKADTIVTGTGTSSNPYVVVTEKLNEKILENNELITATPTLTTSSNNTTDASGLYKSTETNSGDSTYYFRGNIENNYVEFADKIWRIVRINEDGTVRLIMQDGIDDNTSYIFNSIASSYENMYYSNSELKVTLDDWYNNISSNSKTKLVSGNYFCEQARVKNEVDWLSGNATMQEYTSYTPNFKCEIDGNEKGIVNANVGLITYDEVIYAGGYYGQDNNDYLSNTSSNRIWTMSPSGFNNTFAIVWTAGSDHVGYTGVNNTYIVRPVINLKSNVIASGTGTSSDPYKIK